MSTSRPRQPADSGVYHVMNRGIDHQTVFFADVDRREFHRLLAWARRELDVSVLAYCFMGNHYHLLLRAPDVASLSKAMQYVSSVYTQHTNQRLGRDGAMFRGRFHSIPVEDDDYLLRAARYIHRNPLDLPGVSSPRDHPWSSHLPYIGLAPCPSFLDTQPVMSVLGHHIGQAISLFEDRPPPAEDTPTIAEVCAVVALALAVEDLTHGDASLAPGLHRTVLTLVADRIGDGGLAGAIGQALGGVDLGPRTRAVRRARARLESDPMLARVIDHVVVELGTSARPGLRHTSRCA